MRSLLMLLVGATFTALLLWVPALHLVRWTGGGLALPLAVTLALPTALLLAAAARPHPFLTLWAFPVAHLPALVIEPGLTGPLVYGQQSGRWDGGLVALTAVAALGAAWVAATLWTPAASDGPPRPAAAPARPADLFQQRLLGPLALLLAVGIYGAFALAALTRPNAEPLAASLTLLVGVACVWYAVGRLVVGEWGDVLLERDARDSFVSAVRHPPRTRWADVFWAAFLALVGAAFGALWYLR